MKRRINKKRMRCQSPSGVAKLSFARLELKQLLAGDLAVTFVSPVLSATAVEVISVSCPETESESQEESACDVRADDQLTPGDTVSMSAGDVTFSFDFDTTAPTGGANTFQPTDHTEVISIVAEDPPPSDPMPAQKLPLSEPEREIYFGKAVKQESSSTLHNEAVSGVSPRSVRIGTLGHQQLFALISPSEITPDSFGVLAKSSSSPSGMPGDMPSVLGQSLRRIDSAFSSLSLQSSFHQRASLNNPSERFHEFGTSLERADAALSADETKPTTIESSDFAFTLLQSYDSLVEGVPRNLEGTRQPPIKPVEPNEESPESDIAGRGIQIVESAILLAALPSCRMFRDDSRDHRAG